MQKLVKRVAQAERQVARRAARQTKGDLIQRQKRTKQGQIEAVREIQDTIKESRLARRDAWEKGPLAPKRDLGISNYDTINSALRTDWTNQGMLNPKPEILEKRCAWAGGSKRLNLAPQDRVVILDGPDKGKIDRIKAVDPDSGVVTLEERHQAVTSIGLGQINVQPMPLPVSSIRLVYPITNPETGVTKDTIINELVSVEANMQSDNMDFNRFTYGNKWDRLVPTLNQVIPWPVTQGPELVTREGDSIREQVEERTFFYGLGAAPMPASVLDELRNKYSKFRTRHEPWYVEAKEAEAAAKSKRSDLLKSMQMPIQELHAKKRAEREAFGELELSDEMLAKLGEVMAKNKTAALNVAGATEVSSPGQ
jgi:large subunit ribosomal protein L24